MNIRQKYQIDWPGTSLWIWLAVCKDSAYLNLKSLHISGVCAVMEYQFSQLNIQGRLINKVKHATA